MSFYYRPQGVLTSVQYLLYTTNTTTTPGLVAAVSITHGKTLVYAVLESGLGL